MLGCDCDPDRVDFNSSCSDGSFLWEGIEAGIPAFNTLRKSIFANSDDWPRMTWFVRSDSQIKEVAGEAAHSLNVHQKLWQECLDQKDEIAWHPHFYEKNSHGDWVQSLDNALIEECIHEGYESFLKYFTRPTSIHTGWCFQNNVSMNLFNELGIEADCSGLPGINTSRFGKVDRANWEFAPRSPYFPSKDNYQNSGQKSGSLNILEVPCSVGSGQLTRALKISLDKIKRRSVFSNTSNFKTMAPLMTITPKLNRRLIETAVHVAVKNGSNYFFSYTHSDEFLPAKTKSFLKSRIYSLQAFFDNLEYLTSVISQHGMQPEFVTIS